MTSLPNIIAMGEVMLELSPQFSPQRAGPGGFELAYAGDTFNTAVYLARQGLKVSYLTELGSDKFSDQIIALAESESVCMNGCIRSDGALPGLYLIENNAEGEREFYYWRRHSAARQLLMTPEKVQRICRAVGKADVFYLSGVLGILPPNTAKTVEGPVFTGLQATINFNLARVSVSSSAFGSKNEQNQATINSHCR